MAKTFGIVLLGVLSAIFSLVVVPCGGTRRRHHNSHRSRSFSADAYGDGAIDDESSSSNCAVVPPALWCGCDKLEQQCGTGQPCRQYTTAIRDQPLHITLLYEGLCPDCQKFITEVLFDVYQKFKPYIRVELIPFGNARVLGNGTISCQHGEEECRINKFQSCAIHYMHDPLPFIYCLETVIASGIPLEKAAKKCYAKLHPIPHIYDQIIHCFNGPKGDRLQREAAQTTAEAWPDQHQWVPWILVNNASLQATQFLTKGLPTLVCLSRVGVGGEDPIPGCEPF